MGRRLLRLPSHDRPRLLGTQHIHLLTQQDQAIEHRKHTSREVEHGTGEKNGRRTRFVAKSDFLLSRSQVRIFVTHLMAWTFALAALGMICWFLRHGQPEDAMTVFSHVVALVGPIVGFWFGSRGRTGDRDGASGGDGDK